MFGLLLLAVLATRTEPLRSENPDFGIVGPGWLAAGVFAAIVVVHGMAVAALAGRFSSAVEVEAGERPSRLAYLPVLVVAPVFPVLIALILAGALGIGASRVGPIRRTWVSDAVTGGGRWVLAGLALVAAPGAVSALVDIIQS